MKVLLTSRAARTALFLSGVLWLSAISPARAAISPVVTQKLNNGVTLVTREDKIAPRVAISLLIRASAADENLKNSGWRQVLTAALLRATNLPDGKVRTTAQWQQLAQSYGGEFGATTGEDFIELWARGDSAYAPQLLEALLQIASSPRLSEADISWASRRALQIVGQPQAGVAARAADAIARSLYQADNGSPLAYALPDYGTFESLSDLSNEQLRDLHKQFFVAPRMVVSAAGNVGAAGLQSVLSEKLGADKIEVKADVAPQFAPLDIGAPPLSVREMQATGAWVFIAFRTPALSTLPPEDFAALRVLASALGDSSRARLQSRLVREKTVAERRSPQRAKETAEQAAAQWTPRRWAGELVLLAQCDVKNVDAVKNALIDEVHRLTNAPISAPELLAAKNYVRGEWALQHEQPRERAFQTALPPVWNSFPDTDWPQKIDALKTADIQRVSQKYLMKYAVVLVMPE